MVQVVEQTPSIFGKIGQGFGQGLSEQLPKEVNRYRLSQGLQQLGKNAGNLTPLENYSQLASIPGALEHPELIRSFAELLKQQSLINNFNRENTKPAIEQPKQKTNATDSTDSTHPITTTTAESTQAKLNPYIPPTGEQRENQARELMAREPLVYSNIDSARAAVNQRIAADIEKSNAEITKSNLQQQVQNKAEQELLKQMNVLGANVPGTLLNKIEQKALDDVKNGILSEDAAAREYGPVLRDMSEDFANLRSLGDITLVTKNPKNIIGAIDNIRKKAKKGGYLKEAADELIGEDGLTPQFAYASMYPVHEIKPLNKELKSLPDISSKAEKTIGLPGMAGIGITRPKSGINSYQETMKISPKLAEAMGTQGSPLSVAYELEKKGYDPQAWKDYLIKNQETLTGNQVNELSKPQPSFFGWLNDWWLKSFSGIER